MGILMAFAVGYVVGARAGSHDFEEVLASIRAVRESEEFADLTLALRSHVSRALHDLADLVDTSSAESINPVDLVDRVKRLVRPN